MEKVLRSSGRAISNQKSIHPGLERIVARHLKRQWLQPIHKPTEAAWKRLKLETGLSPQCDFILDSGCGTGASSLYFAKQFAEFKVLGVDQSISRLSKNGVRDGLFVDGNLILLRAELSSLWRLMLQEGYRPGYHFLLYPNPWPKSAHLKRRWHAHPVFPAMLALGGEVELRCNWDIYAREFAFASSLACGEDIKALAYKADTPITLFEQKYKQRGHALFSVKIPAELCTAYAAKRTSQDVLSSSTDSAPEASEGGSGGGV